MRTIRKQKRAFTRVFFALVLSAFLLMLPGCAPTTDTSEEEIISQPIDDIPLLEHKKVDAVDAHPRNKPTITESFRSSLSHGEKTAPYQKYIVLHDTEGSGSPMSVVDWWESNGNYVAAQFVIGKDGTIVQCVPLDEIAHHAGFGDTGHNESYGIEEDTRDDKIGTTPIGSWASDYAMNAWSIGIEMVHVGGEGDYPQAQLDALDELIAYIDSYYGFESDIIDHKAWRTGNSDTSKEFARYLVNYQDHRTHD